MGKFLSGQSKPTGSGRAKGRPNNKTFILNSITEDLGINVPRLIGELLPQLDPGKQADVLLELMAYIYPKRKAIELQIIPELAKVAPTEEDLALENIRLSRALADCEEDPELATTYRDLANMEEKKYKQAISLRNSKN